MDSRIIKAFFVGMVQDYDFAVRDSGETLATKLIFFRNPALLDALGFNFPFSCHKGLEIWFIWLNLLCLHSK